MAFIKLQLRPESKLCARMKKRTALIELEAAISTGGKLI